LLETLAARTTREPQSFPDFWNFPQIVQIRGTFRIPVRFSLWGMLRIGCSALCRARGPPQNYPQKGPPDANDLLVAQFPGTPVLFQVALAPAASLLGRSVGYCGLRG
jgi:hypothetical protein